MRKTRLGVEALEARDLMSVGPEFHINTERIFDQSQVAVASQPTLNGRSVAAWTSVNEIGNAGQNISAQIFDGAGNRVGGEIDVADIRFINESEPSVAMDAAGNFVVVWKEEVLGPGSDTMIRGQRFFASGAKNGGVMLIANSTAKESDPDVAMDAFGRFVVSYTVANPIPVLEQATTSGLVVTPIFGSGLDVQAKRFASNGTLLSTINVATSTNSEHSSSIASSPDGRFSIGFQTSQLGRQADIRLKRFTATGALLGNHLISASIKADIDPEIAMDRFGNTIVVWEHAFSATDHDILGRKVIANGVLGSVMAIDTSGLNETNPTVAMDMNDGDFVVAFNKKTNPLFAPSLIVREVGPTGINKLTTNLGSVGFAPALSINDSDRYFMGYVSRQRADDNGLGIRGRRGLIV